MFSELAWGSCDVDGAVDFDSIYSKIGRATPINSKRASNKVKPGFFIYIQLVVDTEGVGLPMIKLPRITRDIL